MRQRGGLFRVAAENFQRAFILPEISLDAGYDAFELDQLPSRERRLVAGHQIGQLPAQPAFAVHQPGCVVKFLVRDTRLKPLFQVLLEFAYFPCPMFERVGIIGLLRQFEDIHRFRCAHQLEHFLFSVAGRLGDNQIRPIQKGVFPGDVITEGGLDQRTHIGGQKLFGGGNGRRRPAAQADRHGAAARMISRGVNSHMIPTMGRPSALAALTWS